MFEKYTLGIEEEFQIVDPQTRELKSHVSEILADGKMLLGEQVKPEMMQAQVEVGTGICRNIEEARADISRLRSIVSHLARQKNLAIIAASTHPISKWTDQEIYDDPHYAILIEELQMVARSLLIFGLHVHVGIEDRERQIHIMNAARYFLPHVLALTTSSPFWLGLNTGLKSYRSEVFKKFPRTDIPDHFDSYQSFERYVQLLLDTNSIDRPKKIWWDVRPHPHFPTLEFRLYRRMLIQENKWRAVRYGLAGKMIDFGKRKEVPVCDLIRELLDFVDDVVDDLGSRREIEHIHTILERGTSADEQLQVFHETNSLEAVVDRLMGREIENGPGMNWGSGGGVWGRVW